MFFLFILASIVFIILLLIFSKIRIQIINFQFSSMKIENRHTNKDYKVILKLYVLGKIPIIKLNITKTRLEKINLKEKVEKIDFESIDRDKIISKNFIGEFKNIKPKINNIDLKIKLGTENACLTSIIVPAISTVIAIFLKRLTEFENQIFLITPIYNNQNLINIQLSGIFEIKMIHIINIVYILKKKGRVKENERTSNRRAYDYSYE